MCTTLFCSLVHDIVGLIDLIVPLLAGIAVLLFMVGGVRYILKADDVHHKDAERKAMLWGLVALFVLFSIWGLLRILDESFFGGVNSRGGGGDPLDIRPESIR